MVDKKGIGAVLVIAIVVIAVCMGAGAYLLLSRGGGPGGGAGAGGGAGESPILTATSLSFKVTTTATVPEQYRGTLDIKMKNIGKPNGKYRVDFWEEREGENSYIIIIYDNSGPNLWQWTEWHGWEDLLSGVPIPDPLIQQIISQYIVQYVEVLKNLGWVSGDVTYTDPSTGRSVTISDIVVNPDLPDSLFQPS